MRFAAKILEIDVSLAKKPFFCQISGQKSGFGHISTNIQLFDPIQTAFVMQFAAKILKIDVVLAKKPFFAKFQAKNLVLAISP